MRSYLNEAFVKGGKAAKKNFIPGICLQVLAVSLILCYYNLPSVQRALDQVGNWNTQWSPWFAILTTMFFGGVIPLSIEALQARREGREFKSLLQVLFTLAVWALNGLLVVLFYDLQARLFGNDQEIGTIIKKVLVDQFLYVPLHVVPFFTIFFLWRDVHFSWSKVRESLQRKGFLARALPLMISNWSVWIPAVSIIYAFPLPLQLILMNLILVFWSLILSFFMSE